MKYADKMVENCIGKLSLPLGLGLNFFINQKEYKVPMVIEEPSVIAAASSAAKYIKEVGGGFETKSTPPIMTGQVQLLDLDTVKGEELILKNKKYLIDKANTFCERMVKRGGGVIDIQVRSVEPSESLDFGDRFSESSQFLVVLLSVNVCDSMGANLVNTICEGIAPILGELTGARPGLRILSNLCMHRKASARFYLPISKMSHKGFSGALVAKRIVEAYIFAKSDSLRAVTHNKGVLNGIDAVALATGQDWRAIEAAAHSWASLIGNSKYGPLTHYRIIVDPKTGEGFLEGSIEMPISVGTRGGAIHSNPLYTQNLELLGNPTSSELAEIILSVGLAQNFGALRALSLEGIQKGHMRLHARNIAISAGVPLDMIQKTVEYMIDKHSITVEAAREFLIKSGILQ